MQAAEGNYVTALEVMLPGIENRQVYSIENIRRIIIGSGEEVDLRLDDRSVEPRQFELYRVNHLEGPVYYLYNLSSSETTRVAGERVGNVRLSMGDMIQAGDCALQIVECTEQDARPLPGRGKVSGNGAATLAAPPAEAEYRVRLSDMEEAQGLIDELEAALTQLAEDKALSVERLEAERDMAVGQLVSWQQAEGAGDSEIRGTTLALEAEIARLEEEHALEIERLEDQRGQELGAARSIIDELQAEIAQLCEDNARQIERLEVERDLAVGEHQRVLRVFEELRSSIPPGQQVLD